MAYKLTKTERVAKERLLYHLWLMDMDEIDVTNRLSELTPKAWHTLEADIDCQEPREKVTLYLDKSVARTFRAMGKGYQARINRLLATWLQMKAAGAIRLNDALVERMGDVSARRLQAVADGEAPPVITRPGDVEVTEEPPEVDW